MEGGDFASGRVCDGGVGVHAPLAGRAGVDELVLDQDLAAEVQHAHAALPARAAVDGGEVGDPVCSVGGSLGGLLAGGLLDVSRGAEDVGHRVGVDELILAVVQECILAFGAAAVVEPAGTVLILVFEVSGGQVIVLAELASPALAEGVDDEIAGVKVAVCLFVSGGNHGVKGVTNVFDAR